MKVKRVAGDGGWWGSGLNVLFPPQFRGISCSSYANIFSLPRHTWGSDCVCVSYEKVPASETVTLHESSPERKLDPTIKLRTQQTFRSYCANFDLTEHPFLASSQPRRKFTFEFFCMHSFLLHTKNSDLDHISTKKINVIQLFSKNNKKLLVSVFHNR